MEFNLLLSQNSLAITDVTEGSQVTGTGELSNLFVIDITYRI